MTSILLPGQVDPFTHNPFFQFPEYLSMERIPVTLEEEVTASVIEWYRVRGQPVPSEELAACRGMDAAQQREFDAIKRVAGPVEEKAAYGTPEFWKQYWAKKKAKEAEMAARGEPIPPKAPTQKKKSLSKVAPGTQKS